MKEQFDQLSRTVRRTLGFIEKNSQFFLHREKDCIRALLLAILQERKVESLLTKTRDVLERRLPSWNDSNIRKRGMKHGTPIARTQAISGFDRKLKDVIGALSIPNAHEIEGLEMIIEILRRDVRHCLSALSPKPSVIKNGRKDPNETKADLRPYHPADKGNVHLGTLPQHVGDKGDEVTPSSRRKKVKKLYRRDSARHYPEQRPVQPERRLLRVGR